MNAAPIESFAGVILWTAQLQRMAAFYRDVLGLPVHSSHDTFVAFQVGAVRLSVGTHSEVHGRARDPLRIMLNLGVDDIHATHDLLVSRGVEFLRPPEPEDWGGWIATFNDPDGNCLQLLQQPGAASPGSSCGAGA